MPRRPHPRPPLSLSRLRDIGFSLWDPIGILRPGEPWEVARLALYLASPDADYVTGQSFTIDGGLEMNWGQGA